MHIKTHNYTTVMTSLVNKKIKEITKIIKNNKTPVSLLTEKMFEVHKIMFVEKNEIQIKKLNDIIADIYDAMPEKIRHPVLKRYSGYKDGRLETASGKISKRSSNINGYILDAFNNNNTYTGRHRFIVECYLQKSLEGKKDVDHIIAILNFMGHNLFMMILLHKQYL